MTLDRLLQIVRLRLRSLFAGAAWIASSMKSCAITSSGRSRPHRRGMTRRASAPLALLAIGGVEQRKEEMRDTRGVSVIEYLIKRPAAGVPATPEAARLCRDGDPVAGARHRRQHRDLPTPERARVPAAAGARAARAGRSAAHRRRTQWPAYRPQRAAVAAAVIRAAAAASRRSRRCWPSPTRASISPTRARFVMSRACGCRARSSMRSAWPHVIGTPHRRQPTTDRTADIPVAVISHALWQREFGGRAGRPAAEHPV